MNNDGSVVLPVTQTAASRGADETSSDLWLRAYWKAVRERYLSETPDAASLAISPIDSLPDNWTVVSISVSEDKSTLFISRQRPQQEPLIFAIPLERHNRRESEDADQQLTFADAAEELETIKNSANDAARRAASLKNEGKEAKVAWWAERKALDLRLQQLLQNIEFCWLGAFKVRVASIHYITLLILHK